MPFVVHRALPCIPKHVTVHWRQLPWTSVSLRQLYIFEQSRVASVLKPGLSTKPLYTGISGYRTTSPVARTIIHVVDRDFL